MYSPIAQNERHVRILDNYLRENKLIKRIRVHSSVVLANPKAIINRSKASKDIKAGIYKYVREIVFYNTEVCNADRFITIAVSQGGLQSVVKSNLNEINPYLSSFKNRIYERFEDEEFNIDFGYRMMIAVK